MKRALSAVLAVSLCMTLVACSVDQILTDINLALQMTGSITTAVAAISPADAALIQAAVQIATNGLQGVQSDYDAYEAAVKAGGPTETALQKLQTAVQTLKSNLQQELASLRIVNPASQQKVTAWVNLVYVVVDAITTLVPQLGAARSARSGSIYVAVVPTPASLKLGWDQNVCGYENRCTTLVKVRNVKR